MTLRSTVRRLSDPTKIITPDYLSWLKTHNDDAYPDWVVDLMREELSKKQRDRTRSFSGSSAGSCARQQLFQYLGVLPPIETMPSVDLISIFDDGRWRHLRWQANLLSAGLLTAIEVPLDWPAKRSKGSMDGMGVVRANHPNRAWRGLDYGFELKGMNGFQYPKAIAKPTPVDKHMAQIDRYFLSSGVDLFVVIYECKLTQRFHEWVITPDKVRIRDQAEELDELNEAVDNQTIPNQLRSCHARMGPHWNGCAYAGRGGICESWRDKGQIWL